MAELVKHMRDRLKDGPDGKPLRFKETTVSNLVDFLGTFDFRNVTDDAELKSLVDRARTMLSGVSADALRTTGDLRAKVQQGMADLAAELDTMVVKHRAASSASTRTDWPGERRNPDGARRRICRWCLGGY